MEYAASWGLPEARFDTRTHKEVPAFGLELSAVWLEVSEERWDALRSAASTALYPALSALGDMRMFVLMLQGRMDAEVEKYAE